MIFITKKFLFVSFFFLFANKLIIKLDKHGENVIFNDWLFAVFVFCFYFNC